MTMMDLNTAGIVGYYPLPDLTGPDSDDETLRHVSEAVHRVNEAVLRAVRTGVSVELIRTSRCHDECGHWGDQMSPAIRQDGPRIHN